MIGGSNGLVGICFVEVLVLLLVYYYLVLGCVVFGVIFLWCVIYVLFGLVLCVVCDVVVCVELLGMDVCCL